MAEHLEIMDLAWEILPLDLDSGGARRVGASGQLGLAAGLTMAFPTRGA